MTEEIDPIRRAVKPRKILGDRITSAAVEHRDDRRILQQDRLRVMQISIIGLRCGRSGCSVDQNIKGGAGISADILRSGLQLCRQLRHMRSDIPASLSL